MGSSNIVFVCGSNDLCTFKSFCQTTEKVSNFITLHNMLLVPCNMPSWKKSLYFNMTVGGIFTLRYELYKIDIWYSL